MSFPSYLIEVGYDLVEEAQTLQTVSVGAALAVELFELRHRGEHHTHAVVRLAVQILNTQHIRSPTSVFKRSLNLLTSCSRSLNLIYFWNNFFQKGLKVHVVIEKSTFSKCLYVPHEHTCVVM